MKNTEKSRQQVPSSFDEANIDIGAFFARKKPQKSKKVRIILKPQLHIHGFGPGRATVHPDLASR